MSLLAGLSQQGDSISAHNAAASAHLNIVRRTLAANLTLTAADSSQQKILPDADRDVTLPAEGSGQWLFVLCHGGTTHTVTVRRSGGTAVASLVAGSVVIVAWDGTDISIC